VIGKDGMRTSVLAKGDTGRVSIRANQVACYLISAVRPLPI
jgi:hypothetical protein